MTTIQIIVVVLTLTAIVKIFINMNRQVRDEFATRIQRLIDLCEDRDYYQKEALDAILRAMNGQVLFITEWKLYDINQLLYKYYSELDDERDAKAVYYGLEVLNRVVV